MRDRLLGVVAPALVGVVVVAVGSAAAAEVGPFGSNDGGEAALVRVEPPQLIGRDQTSDGSEASIRHSNAKTSLRPDQAMTCVSVERSATGTADESGRPGSGELCGPAPQEGRLTFAVDTVAPEPSTDGRATELHHFVSGFTKGEASRVVIEDSSGQSAKLDVTAAEDGSTKVFWGPIPRGFRDGKVSIEAFRPDGTSVAEGSLSIGDPPPGVPPLR